MEGYKTADRFSGLDLDHVKLTLSKLAKSHAASVVYLEQGGKFDAKYDEGFYSPKMIEIFDTMYEANVVVMREATKDWDCAKTLNVFFDNWREIFLKKIFPIAQGDESRFQVLCHGDLWCNNIMFKYNSSGQVEDCLLVDLQICSYRSPLLDLQYFIFSSLHKDIRLSKIDFIISVYHRELVANLKKLGYKKKLPTLLQLQRDFLELGLVGLGTSLGTLPIALVPATENSDINSFVGDTDVARNFKMQLYGNPNYREAMEQLVPYFERKGYFEV